MYVADFRKGRVQVYDSSFNHVHAMEHQFRDWDIPDGYAPFNIQNIGGELYVTYAKQDDRKHDEIDGPGLGFVDVFSPLPPPPHGPRHLAQRPLGLAMAPGDFGIYSHDLLVGQFGSGNIAVYDPITGEFKGLLNDSTNAPSPSMDSGDSPSAATEPPTPPPPSTSRLISTTRRPAFGATTPIQNTRGNSQ